MNETQYPDNIILVSKTDLKGIITYANENFISVSGYSEHEIIGKPHSLVRHPDMPKIIFKLLWETIQSGEEINAYVINKTKDGNYYWVFANVVASIDIKGNTLGYHSTRHKPTQKALEIVQPLYKKLHEIEVSSGVEASLKELEDILKKKGLSYDEFVLSI